MRFLVAVTVLALPCLSKEQSDGSLTKGIRSFFAEIGIAASCLSQTLSLCENSQDHATYKQRARNCADLLEKKEKESGVRTIYPYNSCCDNHPVSVYCDQTSDGGGWTVIQHREALSQREDFFRGWTEYRLGFGNLTGEFWLGLENIHLLVKDILMELKVDLVKFDGEKKVAKYDYFYISDSSDKFRLEVGSYSGNAGDSLTFHNGMQFSTKDHDSDIRASPPSCANEYKGAWWYGDCHQSNLNGYQYEGEHKSHADGINWFHYTGMQYSLKETTLSIRPRFRH